MLVSATALLAWVAHRQINEARTQLHHLSISARGDFLIRLDERFSNKQIIEARVIIHRIYRNTQPTCTHEREQKKLCSSCNTQHMQKMRDTIKDIGRNEREAHDFILLKTFLEFLETIGYFTRKGYIQFNEVNELIGGTIEFHYELFKDWITYLQSERNSNAFREFEWLAWKINPSIVSEDKHKMLNDLQTIPI